MEISPSRKLLSVDARMCKDVVTRVREQIKALHLCISCMLEGYQIEVLTMDFEDTRGHHRRLIEFLARVSSFD